MQLMIRAKVCAAQTIDDPDDLRAVAKQTAADTIYGIDVVGEEAVQEWFRDQWPAWLPVEVIMEGIEDGKSLCFPEGIPRSATEWKCIIDPIDGIRNLMYDKRSAWVLGGIAPQAGAANTLRDIQEAGVIVEDPLTQAAVCAPLNTTAPVSWAGYANACLADHIRPELKRAIQDTLLDAPGSYSHRSVGAKVSCSEPFLSGRASRRDPVICPEVRRY